MKIDYEKLQILSLVEKNILFSKQKFWDEKFGAKIKVNVELFPSGLGEVKVVKLDD